MEHDAGRQQLPPCVPLCHPLPACGSGLPVGAVGLRLFTSHGTAKAKSGLKCTCHCVPFVVGSQGTLCDEMTEGHTCVLEPTLGEIVSLMRREQLPMGHVGVPALFLSPV